MAAAVDGQRTHKKLLEDVVERLVGVSNDESALLREGVVDVGDYLHRRISFARARRSDHNCKPRVHRRPQPLHLHRREAHGVHAWRVFGVRAGHHRFVGGKHDLGAGGVGEGGVGRAGCVSGYRKSVGRRGGVVDGQPFGETHVSL